MTPKQRNFASDNNAPVCPEAWALMEEANHGHAHAYGTDDWTTEACELIREVFETDCEVFFVFNGTAANSLILATLCRSYHAVIAHELSHVETDECAAPEFFTGGSKILTVQDSFAKIHPETVRRMASQRSDLHFPKCHALSITQSTELGTVYTTEQLEELGTVAKDLGLHLHMDGARFANAVSAQNCAPKAITWEAGIDVLSFGGTKNGMAIGEAIVFFDKSLAAEFEFRCKQAGQLCSKMRYLSAPWVGLLRDGAWLRHARHANDCARRLNEGLKQIPGIEIPYPTEANAVFPKLEDRVISGLYAHGWQFYDFGAAGACRLMCSWDTQFDDVDAFVADVNEITKSNEDRRDEFPVIRH